MIPLIVALTGAACIVSALFSYFAGQTEGEAKGYAKGFAACEAMRDKDEFESLTNIRLALTKPIDKRLEELRTRLERSDL